MGSFYFTALEMGNMEGKPYLRDSDIEALAEASGKAAEDIKESYDNFITEYPHGRMDKNKFKELMSEAHGKKKDRQMIDAVFRVYDNNRDGYVDFVEFMTVFYILSEKPPQEIMTRMFQMFDINHDGVISKDEMLTLVKALFSLQGSKEPDKCSKELVTKAFAEMDTNKDNKINTEEFIKAVMGHRDMSKLIAEKALNSVV